MPIERRARQAVQAELSIMEHELKKLNVRVGELKEELWEIQLAEWVEKAQVKEIEAKAKIKVKAQTAGENNS